MEGETRVRRPQHIPTGTKAAEERRTRREAQREPVRRLLEGRLRLVARHARRIPDCVGGANGNGPVAAPRDNLAAIATAPTRMSTASVTHTCLASLMG